MFVLCILGQPTPTDSSQKDSESPDPKDSLDLPPKQTLGKGKRARIPNKRYGDILISPRQSHSASDAEKTTKKSAVENGVPQEKENVSVEPKATGKSTQAPAAQAKKAKGGHDLSNPNFLKPFKYGWKRELVYRATYDNNLRRNSDIYYYTPNGKKVRSMREVAENLKNKELTLDDFTFAKEPLGVNDPEKEIVRDAKYKSGPGSTDSGEGIKATGAAVKKAAAGKGAAGGAKAARGQSPSVAGNSKAGAASPKSTGMKVGALYLFFQNS